MASSNLAAQAAFGWCEKFPLMEPVIGSSLKCWLKKNQPIQKNRKQSLQNQHFCLQVSRPVVKGRTGIAMISLPPGALLILQALLASTSVCSGAGAGTAPHFLSPRDSYFCPTPSHASFTSGLYFSVIWCPFQF